MAIIERSSLVTYSAEQMYDLVNDVASYPEFLNWCVGSEIHRLDPDAMEASITVALAGMQQTFTTRNQLSPGEGIAMSLISGPFQRLEGNWSFRQLGAEGSKVSLHLQFKFTSRLLSSAFSRGFSRVAERLVSDFCQRAGVRYG
jgi:ribosome-associated toxin RatA of RatAB toxin-antitoxin module